MMKKKLIWAIVIIIGLGVLVGGFLFLKNYYKVKNAVVIIDLKEDRTAEFLSEVKVSDFINYINGTIVDDYIIDTKTIGEKEINYVYINEDNIKLKESFRIEVVDTVAPVVWLNSTYSVNVGSEDNLLDKILCGDNYDANPKCQIIGEYDLNEVNVYPLVFEATDMSGNKTTINFNLNVKELSKNNNSSSGETTVTYFKDIVDNYKTEETQIGLDISRWQGNVDFEKLKEAGVEFVILRVGGNTDIDSDNFLDANFKENIEKANEVGIPVGIYFYSYASNKEQAIKDANWVLEQIKDYKVDLPIAFDWENWSFYNEFNLSFFGLTDMATAFLDVFKNAGYEGMLYSSKNYLERIWLPIDYPVWLANYTSKTTYQGNYDYWQICSDGKVEGIEGAVDIDIRYKK